MGKFSKFEAADYLDSEEMIAEYLTAALDDENPEVFLAALADVVKARGMNGGAVEDYQSPAEPLADA